MPRLGRGPGRGAGRTRGRAARPPYCDAQPTGSASRSQATALPAAYVVEGGRADLATPQAPALPRVAHPAREGFQRLHADRAHFRLGDGRVHRGPSGTGLAAAPGPYPEQPRVDDAPAGQVTAAPSAPDARIGLQWLEARAAHVRLGPLPAGGESPLVCGGPAAPAAPGGDAGAHRAKGGRNHVRALQAAAVPGRTRPGIGLQRFESGGTHDRGRRVGIDSSGHGATSPFDERSQRSPTGQVGATRSIRTPLGSVTTRCL